MDMENRASGDVEWVLAKVSRRTTIEKWAKRVGITVAMSLVTVTVIWLTVWGGYGWSVRNQRHACHVYGERTLQDAELVNTGFMSWRCFVRVDGHWVLRDQIRVIVGDNG